MLEGAFSRQLAARVHTDRESRYVKELALSTDRIEEIVMLYHACVWAYLGNKQTILLLPLPTYLMAAWNMGKASML